MRTPRLLLAIAVGMVLTASTPSTLGGAASQLGSRSSEEWIKTLDSPKRVEGLKIPEVVARLQLKPGDTVADIGAGTGLFALPLARAVEPGGTAYAVEIDQGLVDAIVRKARDQQVSNLQGVLGQFDDPNLPPASLDLAFIHDVLHHIQNRSAYLKALARAMKPTGRIAVIDFHPESGGHRDQPDMQVTRELGAKLMAEVGFAPTEEFGLFAEKWFVVYSRR